MPKITKYRDKNIFDVLRILHLSEKFKVQLGRQKDKQILPYKIRKRVVTGGFVVVPEKTKLLFHGPCKSCTVSFWIGNQKLFFVKGDLYSKLHKGETLTLTLPEDMLVIS
jgi:hypothetical protein